MSLRNLIEDLRREHRAGTLPRGRSDTVTLEITEAQWWAYPARVRERVQLYGSEVAIRGGVHYIEMADYRLAELEALMREGQGGGEGTTTR